MEIFLKKKQSGYKPGSVYSGWNMSVIYPHLPSPTSSIVLPSDGLCSDGPPSLRRYTRTFSLRCARLACRHTTGGLLPHLLTLTDRNRRLFSSALINPHGLLPIKKRSVLRCPDFPPAPPIKERTRQTARLFLGLRIYEISVAPLCSTNKFCKFASHKQRFTSVKSLPI